MDCVSVALLSDWLLVACQPYATAILVSVKDGFILHNQYMFFLSRLKCGWDAIECFIIISHH